MPDHLLEPAERKRFVQYCREEAMSYSALMEQVEKLGPAMKAIVAHHKLLATAYTMVAQHLESVEDQTIGS